MRLEMFARIAITTATYIAMMGSTQAAGLATATTANDGTLQQHDSLLVMAQRGAEPDPLHDTSDLLAQTDAMQGFDGDAGNKQMAKLGQLYGDLISAIKQATGESKEGKEFLDAIWRTKKVPLHSHLKELKLDGEGL